MDTSDPVFLNGEFVPADRAAVSVFDRGFLYGDGLFETIRVHGGRAFLWDAHLDRLEAGAQFLRLALPLGRARLAAAAAELIRRADQPEGNLRLTVTRGVGPRGYSPRGADRPTLCITMHPAPPLAEDHPTRWRLHTASFRVPANDPLARFKTGVKLLQVLARAEADAAGADEALLLNDAGCVAEGASSNLFWIASGQVCTPPLSTGALAGVTRGFVGRLCADLGAPVTEMPITREALLATEGLFCTLSSLGVVEAVALDNLPLARSPIVARIRAAYFDAVRRFVQDR